MATLGIDEPLQLAGNKAAVFHNTITGRFKVLASLTEILADFLTVLLSVLLILQLYPFARRLTSYGSAAVVTLVALFAAVVVFMLDHQGAYQWGESLLSIRETERVLRVSYQCWIALVVLSLFFEQYISHWLPLMVVLVMAPGLILEKHLLRSAIGVLHAHGFGAQRVLIYGAGYTGRSVASALFRSASLGLTPVCMVDDSPSMAGKEILGTGYNHRHKLYVERGPLTHEQILESGAGIVIVAIPTLGRDKLASVAAVAAATGAQLAFVPNNASPTDYWIEHSNIDGLMLSFIGGPAAPFGYDYVKRAVDFALSLTALIALSPLMLLIAAWVKLDSPGPAFFEQDRVGKDGTLFRMFKFRTMYRDAERHDYSPLNTLDIRITKAGRWLRRSSLDELPQLINVLKGEMALVGPRPEMPFIVDKHYGPRERRRLAVLPGITGLWQLSADRAFLIHENISYDLYYIRNRNLFMDFAVLAHTLVFAMRGI